MGQTIQNIESRSFIVGGNITKPRDSQIIAQDAGRTEPLLSKTVIGLIASTQKWTPLVDIAATNGTVEEMSIYEGPDILAADLVAGDITGLTINRPIDFDFAEDLLVLENSYTLETVIGAASIGATTIRKRLESNGWFATVTDFILGAY